MSATISSTRVISPAITYAWTGLQAQSASVRRENGVETGRNRCTNPSFEALTTSGWTAEGGAVLDIANPPGGGGYAGRLRVGGDAYTTASAVAGEVIEFSVEYQTLGTVTGTPRLVIAVPGGGTATTALPLTQSGPARFSVRATATAAGTVTATVFSATSGGVTYFDKVFIGQPSTYFDGSTPTVPEVREATAPYFVLGYETTRNTGNVFHDVLGGGTDVTIREAELRSGTLRMLYLDADTARDALAMFGRAEVFSFDDPEVPGVAMSFALAGQLVLTLDSETMLRWVLAVGYQEVTA